MAPPRQVAPGIYEDDKGGLHLLLAELLEDAGFPVTDANLQMMEAAAREQLAVAFPGVPITVAG